MSVHDSGDHLAFGLSSADGSIRVTATVAPTSHLPQSSVFDDLDHVSDFFKRGSLGYSVRPGRNELEGLELQTANWSVVPAHVEKVESTFFDDPTLFPEGSAELDNALVMRGIHHTWQAKGLLRHGAELDVVSAPS